MKRGTYALVLGLLFETALSFAQVEGPEFKGQVYFKTGGQSLLKLKDGNLELIKEPGAALIDVTNEGKFTSLNTMALNTTFIAGMGTLLFVSFPSSREILQKGSL